MTQPDFPRIDRQPLATEAATAASIAGLVKDELDRPNLVYFQQENLDAASCPSLSAQSDRYHAVDNVRVADAHTPRLKSRSQPFRFLDLPAEIRLTILRYTDLVAPLKEVYWNEKLKYHVFLIADCETAIGSMQDQHFHYACQFRQCSQGFRCRPGPAPELPTSSEEYDYRRLAGCLHRYELDADVPDDWKCRCWAPPRAFFQVCRRMHREAEEVFFQENRFVVYSIDGFCKPPGSNPLRLAPSIFLNRLRPAAAKSLRMLEIVFPPFDTDYCPEDSVVHADWAEAVRRAVTNLQTMNLTVRVYMTDHLMFEYEQDRLPDWRLNMSAENGNQLLETYRRILAPLSELSELKGLLLSLSWPWQWVAREDMDWEDGGAHSEGESKKLENEMGQSLFGKADYARMAVHEDDYPNSQWLQWTRSDFYV